MNTQSNTINSFGSNLFVSQTDLNQTLGGSLNPSSISVGNLIPNQTLKTDANKVLVSSQISKSDLDFSPMVYTGTLPAPVGNFTKISDIDGNVEESSITETDITNLQTDVGNLQTDVGNLQTDVGNLQTDVGNLQTDVGNLQTDVGTLQTDVGTLQTDVGLLQTDVSNLQNDKLDKLNDTATNLSVNTSLNITGQLNYRKTLSNPLYDTGLWSDYTLEKGLISGGVPSLTYPSPTTSDEARTITISAGSGFIQIAGGAKSYLEFLQTDVLIPPNSNGRIRVSNTGVVSFLNNPNITNSLTNFVLCRVITNTDSIIFIDAITALGIPNKENLQSEANLTFGTYFNQNTALSIEETPTPLFLNDLGFTYYYKNQSFTSGGKSNLEFFKFHRDTGEALGYKQLPATQTVDDLYDNGTNNVVSIPSGKYKKDLFFYLDWQYQLFGQRRYFIIYSTQLYDTLKEAQIASNPPIPSFIPTGAVQLCAFIVKKDGATTILSEIQDARKFLTSEIPYASRDDHSQYLLLDGSRKMTGNLDLNNNDIVNCDEIKTDKLTSSTDTKILINSDLDFQNTYQLKNISLINNIQPSGGLYSESSGYTILAANTVETNLLGQGSSSGSLSIPANSFTALSFYSFKASGILTGGANDTFTLKALSLTGIPSVVELGTIQVQLTDNGLVDKWWYINIDFTIRSVGGLGVAYVVLSGDFRYTNNNDVVKTVGRLFTNNTTFSTETSNTLVLEYKNDVTNPLSSFTIDQASFTKWF